MFENQMINWYDDDKLAIFFNGYPAVGIRYITPSMSDELKKSVEKYPFICKKDLKVAIFDKSNKDEWKKYCFTIPKGYCYDGASIPRPFWVLVGANTDNKFLIPALIHDVLCENHQYINNDKSLSTNVFNALLLAGDVGPVKRCLMKNSVACFQTLFCGWGK